MTRCYHNLLQRYRSFSANKINLFRLSLAGGLLFITYSCSEDPTRIGEELLPGSDFVSIHSTDTIGVRSYTAYTDSVRTDNPSYLYLGKLYDPYFGTTTASSVSELRLYPDWNYSNFTIDSVKLFLSVLVKGNPNAGHILRLSEIADQIYTDSAYYSNRSVKLSGFSMDLYLPELKVDTVNTLVLDVPVDFGTYITRDPSMLFYNNSIPDFRSFFKGFYFQLVPASGEVFMTLDVTPAQYIGVYDNYFIVYLHTDAGSNSFLLALDSYTRNASFNRFTHDYSSGVPGKRIEHINDGYADSLTYLQGLNGVYTKILLPGLDIIKKDPSLKGISINKARLVFPYWNTGTGYAQSGLPAKLLMRYTDNSGVRYYVPDYNPNGSSIYDGTIDTVAGVYNFNIPSFVQSYLKDTENKIKPELDLFIQSGSTQKVIMRANGNSKPVKFEFTYTKF